MSNRNVIEKMDPMSKWSKMTANQYIYDACKREFRAATKKNTVMEWVGLNIHENKCVCGFFVIGFF